MKNNLKAFKKTIRETHLQLFLMFTLKKLNTMKHNEIVGLKELRENMGRYITKVKKGNSFVVVKKSKPVFRISPADEAEEMWETVIDFTKIKKAGVPAEEVLAYLKKLRNESD